MAVPGERHTLRVMFRGRHSPGGARPRVSGPFVIVGGEPDPVKLDRLGGEFGVVLDWIAIDRAWSLVDRLHGGAVRGIVQLEGLVSHSGMRPVLRAARRHGVPVLYARRGGLLALRVALRTLMASR